MANVLLTPSIIAREALMVLRTNTVMASLVHRNHSQEFAQVGDTITVPRLPTFEAEEFNPSTGINIQNAEEAGIPVVMDKHLDVSFAVTSKELTLDIRDFSKQFLVPAMQAFAQRVDNYLLALARDIPFFAGAAGTTPASVETLLNVRKRLNDNAVPLAGRRTVIDTAAEAKLLGLEVFHAADKVGDDGTALREASLGRKLGADHYMDQNVNYWSTGITGTLTAPQINGTVAAGATVMNIDATALTGKLKHGQLFTVAGVVDAYGNSVTFTVTEDSADAATNAINGVKFYPAAPTGGFTDDAAITFIASHTMNVGFHQNAFAMVSRPLALPMGAAPSLVDVVSYDGFTLRVVRDYDSKFKKDVISLDMLCGFKTLQPELACRLLG